MRHQAGRVLADGVIDSIRDHGGDGNGIPAKVFIPWAATQADQLTVLRPRIVLSCGVGEHSAAMALQLAVVQVVGKWWQSFVDGRLGGFGNARRWGPYG